MPRVKFMRAYRHVIELSVVHLAVSSRQAYGFFGSCSMPSYYTHIYTTHVRLWFVGRQL